MREVHVTSAKGGSLNTNMHQASGVEVRAEVAPRPRVHHPHTCQGLAWLGLISEQHLAVVHLSSEITRLTEELGRRSGRVRKQKYCMVLVSKFGMPSPSLLPTHTVLVTVARSVFRPLYLV